MSEVDDGESRALYYEDDSYALASYHQLRSRPLNELIAIANRNASRTGGNRKFVWPLWITVYYTAPEFFEEVAAQQYVRPQSGIEFAIEEDGTFYVGIRIVRRTPALEWPEMRHLLTAWSSQRDVTLDELAPYHRGHPHNWEAFFEYPSTDHSVERACALAQDAMAFVAAFESGALSRDVLVAMLNSGQASLLIGVPESGTLEVKRPHPLETQTVQFELAKDIAAMANTPTGGVIIFGAETKNVSGVDVIKRIIPVRDVQSLVRKVRAIAASKIYPPLAGLDIRAVQATTSDSDGSVLLIDVPNQPHELRPILVSGASIDNKVRSIFVSIPIRDNDGTALLTLPALHARLVAGSAWLAGQPDPATD